MNDVIKLNEEQNKVKTDLISWFNSSETIATIEGFAGTGKTTLVKYFTDNLISNKKIDRKDIIVSAPTNTATKLIAKKSNLLGKTIHSILGLLPNTDLKDFNPLKLEFKSNKEQFTKFKFWIIDESSMINQKLYKTIKEFADKNDIKVIFMGDRYQLPPVNEPLSRIFFEADKIYRLNTVVRQAENNPNTKLIKSCIEDVKIEGKTAYNLANNAIGFGDSLVVDKEDNLIGYICLKEDGEPVEFFHKYKENFKEGTTKLLAFTNNYVAKFNSQYRKDILNYNEYLKEGENLIGYRNIYLRDYTPVITNSEVYKIKKVYQATDKGIKYYNVLLYYAHRTFMVKIVDMNDKDTRIKYIDKVNNLYNDGKTYGRGAWANYYKYINEYLSMENIKNVHGTFISKKALDYSYAMTVHKSQGMTFTNTFIALENIMYSSDRTRLMYVACSRATNLNVFI